MVGGRLFKSITVGLGLLGIWLPLLAEESTPELFIEAELSPTSPYVQAQVEYRVRLYRVPTLSQGSLILPEMAQMVVEQAGEAEPVDVERHGRRYLMQEQRYLLFPQRSGSLTVPAPVFSGRAAFARGPVLEIDVKPRPVGQAIAPWLPAHRIHLQETWHTPDPPWHPGDLLERVVTIEAEGLTGAQLPTLALPVVVDMQVSRLGDEVENQISEGRLLGRRIQRQRFVAEQDGEYTLPLLRLAWWDTLANEGTESTLPGRKLLIAPLPGDSPLESKKAPITSGQEVAAPPIMWLSSPVLWGLAGVLLIVLLRWLYGWLRSPVRQHRRTMMELLRQVEAACYRGDAPAVARGLLDWAAHGWGGSSPWTLGRLAARLGHEGAAKAIWELDAALYGSGSDAWQGEQFVQAVLPHLKSRRIAPGKNLPRVLPPLNP
jgi:hypothetical protein